MPSRSSERYADGSNLQNLDINAFGYAVFKFSTDLLPLVIWPTAVFVAEKILGNRKNMAAAGINIIEDPKTEMASIFGSYDSFLAFDSLRSNFETGPR